MRQRRSIIQRLLNPLRQLRDRPCWNGVQFNRSPLQRYGMSVLAVAIASLVKIALDSFIDLESPFLLFFAAVMLSGWYGGTKAGALATLLATVASDYFFLPPLYSFMSNAPGENLRLVLFLVEGVFISVTLGVMQAAQQRSEASAREAKRHLQSLRHSEERFRLLIEGVKDYGIYMLDADGYVVSWNTGAERIKGYSAAEIIGQHFSRFYTPEDIAVGKPEQNLQIAARSGRLEEEGQRVRKDGSRFWADVVITPLRDEAGRLQGFSKITRDISDRVRAEEENSRSIVSLQESEQRFRALTEATFEGVVIYENGTAIDANKSFARMFGYELHEVIGMSQRDFLTSESVTLAIVHSESGSEQPFEVTGVKKDGTTFPLEVLGRKNTYQGRTVRVSSVRDLTERKRAEEHLRNLVKELSDIKFALDKSAIVARTDGRGTIDFVNDKFCQISKYSREELIGQNHRIINSGYHPKEFFANLWSTISKGQVWRGEIKNRAKDGTYYWVDTAIVPFLDERGKPLQYLAIRYDITDRKQIEEEKTRLLASVRESEERFRHMADTAPVLLWMADPKGVCTFFNKSWLNFTGYTLDEQLAQGWTEGVHRDDLDWCLQIYSRAFQTGDRFTLEYRFRRADGEERWILNKGVPRLTPDGSFAGFIGSAIDVTEMKQAEAERTALLEREQAAREQAEANEQYYRFLAESIPQMVWTAQPDGGLDYVNDRWFEYTGMTLEDVRGWGWAPIVHPDDLPGCVARWQHSLATGENYKIEARIKRVSDGTYRWTLGLAVPMRDKNGQILKWFGTNTDIHEQKQAQEERAELLDREQAARTLAERATNTLQRLQSITDAAIAPLSLNALLNELLNRIAHLLKVDTAAIVLMEPDGTHLVVKATKGLEEETDLQFRIPLGEGFAGAIAQTRQPMLIERDAHTQVYSPVLRRTEIQSLMGIPLRVEDRILGVMHVGTLEVRQFTTEELHLLERAADRIAVAIDRAQLYEAEQKARNDAEKANRLKDEFLAIVSHELRTPLNSILGWSQLLRNRKLNEATNVKALETIERNAKQQVALIDDILDVSRIIRGKIRLTMLAVNWSTIVEEAIESVTPSAEAKSIQIHAALDPSIGTISGDPDRLQQIAWNLLFNAVKFTPQGGQIDIAIDRTGSQVGLKVRDNGIGISAEFLPHVFEGFRQANSSTTRSHGGLGLGLTIVRYLVELHGGTIEAFSEGEGKGATFTVKLPISTAKPKEQPGDRAIANQQELFNNLGVLDGLRVLVVDDDRDTGELIGTVLQEYGVEATVVLSASDALNALERWTPDILVSDIGMPGEDGYALIRKVRQRELARGGGIPAIALTAFAREEDRARAMEAGFQRHVPKPVEPAKLAIAIANLAGHS